MSTPDEIELAPFPPLEWADDCWEGSATRPPAWRKLRVESEQHLKLVGGETKHQVRVYRKTQRIPKREQCEAYRAFLDGGKELVSLVLGAIHASYGPMRLRWLEQTPELELPEVATAGELVRMTKLSTVYVHDVVAGGRAYLGIALRCAWDQEHGAGVMLHGDRVVGVGGHDEAMHAWVAARDARRRPRKNSITATPKATRRSTSRA